MQPPLEHRRVVFVPGAEAERAVDAHLAANQLELNEIGVCNLSLDRPIPFDPYTVNRDTGGFVIIDMIACIRVIIEGLEIDYDVTAVPQVASVPGTSRPFGVLIQSVYRASDGACSRDVTIQDCTFKLFNAAAAPLILAIVIFQYPKLSFSHTSPYVMLNSRSKKTLAAHGFILS